MHLVSCLWATAAVWSTTLRVASRTASIAMTGIESGADRDKTKAALYRVALLGGRGVWARPAERAEAAKLVEILERSATESPVLQDGTWELVLSDVEPFRASAFFLALGEAVEAKIAVGASDGALTVHALAAGGGEIGRVAHVIESGCTRLHSLVELRSGSLPSLPLALTGTVISSGELLASSSASSPTYELTIKNTTVQDNALRYGLPTEGGLQPGTTSPLAWIGDQLVESGAIFERVLEPLGGAPTAALSLSYADEDLMIWRTPRLGKHWFVLAKGDEAAWPAMGELRRRQQASQTQSTIGSVFALGMLNPFFTRATGMRK